jgi:conjugal transfer mating pair stabilization protein TraG
MLRVKPGVRLHGVRPEMVFAATVVDVAYDRIRVPECWITSGIDGVHSEGSAHYDGRALDFRAKTVPVESRKGLAELIREALGADFDVVLEDGATDYAHLHVEFQPKLPY